MDPIQPWTFIDHDGVFRLADPQRSSYLYFPLVNEAGMISAISPTLHGDAKTDQHTFLLPPTSVEDLHASRAARNFWVYVAGVGAWSATGSSAAQQAAPEAEQVTLEAGFLWHKLIRVNPQIGLRSEITSFVPANAGQRGESVAFSAFYASNLRQLSRLALELQSLGIQEVELLAELLPLLDTLSTPVDYNSPAAKQTRLAQYFETVQHAVSGQKARVGLADLASDLAAKAEWLAGHLREQEWVQDKAGYGWFNGYYDNAGQRLEGDHPNGARMTLTGQVFPLMGDIATWRSCSAMRSIGAGWPARPSGRSTACTARRPISTPAGSTPASPNISASAGAGCTPT